MLNKILLQVLVVIYILLWVSCSSFNEGSSSNSNRFSNHPSESADNKPIKTSKITHPRRMVGLVKQEREQLYEAYNLLHSLAQVSIQFNLKIRKFKLSIQNIGI